MSLKLSNASLQKARNLPFCYYCGHQINKNENHPDHIPPQAIFSKNDRNYPLKVAAHYKCNNMNSSKDEVIGQLIAIIHGKLPPPKFNRLNVKVFKTPISGVPHLAIIGADLAGQIWRWVRAFHAALYTEFLPDNVDKAIHPPLVPAKLEGGDIVAENVMKQQYLFVKLIKENRIIDCVDRIISNNGKCLYECVWVRMDDGSWGCVFALQIYNWITLADKHFPPRGCVGLYQPNSGIPSMGTKATPLQIPVMNIEPLNPFERKEE
jgi:hypothetical protein